MKNKEIFLLFFITWSIFVIICIFYCYNNLEGLYLKEENLKEAYQPNIWADCLKLISTLLFPSDVMKGLKVVLLYFLLLLARVKSYIPENKREGGGEGIVNLHRSTHKIILHWLARVEQYIPAYSGKQIVRGDLKIFSSNRS